jgi:hypothetical protein
MYLKEAGSEAEATAGHAKRLPPTNIWRITNILGKKKIYQALKIKIKNLKYYIMNTIRTEVLNICHTETL